MTEYPSAYLMSMFHTVCIISFIVTFCSVFFESLWEVGHYIMGDSHSIMGDSD